MVSGESPRLITSVAILTQYVIKASRPLAPGLDRARRLSNMSLTNSNSFQR